MKFFRLFPLRILFLFHRKPESRVGGYQFSLFSLSKADVTSKTINNSTQHNSTNIKMSRKHKQNWTQKGFAIVSHQALLLRALVNRLLITWLLVIARRGRCSRRVPAATCLWRLKHLQCVHRGFHWSAHLLIALRDVGKVVSSESSPTFPVFLFSESC